jgi:hypothetical protein
MSRNVFFTVLVSFALGALITLSFCSTAFGQTIVHFRVLSSGHEGYVQSVGKIRYYLLDEYLQLAAFDSELFTLRAEAENGKEIELELKKQLDVKEVIIKSLESDTNTFKERSDRLDLNLKTCEVALGKASSNNTVWPYFVAAGGSILGIVGTTLYMASLRH